MDFSARFDGWFEKLPSSPKEDGSVVHCVVRPPGGTERELPQEIRLTPDGGIEGDKWSTDKKPDPEVEVSVTSVHVVRSCAGEDDPERMALSGDNLQVDLDLSEENLPAGTLLRIGETVLRVSEAPHRPCRKFSRRFGSTSAKRVARADRVGRRGRGLLCRIVEGGTIRVGDRIQVERPAS